MSTSRTTRLAAGLALSLLVGACASPYDYGPYLQAMPRSILVLPPLDETVEVDACYGWLSTATRPLAERGYYVFPVGLVDRIMRENGLPTAGEMHTVSLQKLDEIFGPDAVLYVTVTNWGTEYQVINSSTIVSVEATLVDVHTGAVIWSGSRTEVKSSNQDNQGGLAEALVGAVVNQVMTSIADPSRTVSEVNNRYLFGSDDRGLLLGHRHPGYAEDQLSRRQDIGRL